MNNIASNLAHAGLYNRQSQPDLYSSHYVRERSLSMRENLDTELVIKTSEGDLVSINSSSYSSLDAATYDARGVLRADGMMTAYSQSERAISLASGESFSFSVQGDLSKEEIADIESLLKVIDGVITELKDGDMTGTMEKAMDLGGYDTLSAFSADMSYEYSYSESSAVSSSIAQFLPSEEGEQQLAAAPSTDAKGRDLINFDKFMNKLLDKIDKHGDKHLAHANKPIDMLFDHHLKKLEDDAEGNNNEIITALDKAISTIDSIIEKLTGTSLTEDNVASIA